MGMIIVKEIDLDGMLNDPEIWMMTAFSFAVAAITAQDPDIDEELADEYAIDSLYKMVYQYIIADPFTEEELKDRFYRASDKFFKKEGVKGGS